LEYLKDLQTRNILTRPDMGLNGVYCLGDQVFALLRGLLKERTVKGAYFTHYCWPPRVEPHVKVGIRFEKPPDLDAVASILNELCGKQKYLVIDKGRFEHTTGEFEHLPPRIVVDYIVCHSFEFLLKHTQELRGKSQTPNEIARFLLLQKEEISTHIKVGDIFRNELQARLITQEEGFWIQERFIHHLLNSCKVASGSEAEVWRILTCESGAKRASLG
jgi:hypothetical protein